MPNGCRKGIAWTDSRSHTNAHVGFIDEQAPQLPPLCPKSSTYLPCELEDQEDDLHASKASNTGLVKVEEDENDSVFG